MALTILAALGLTADCSTSAWPLQYAVSLKHLVIVRTWNFGFDWSRWQLYVSALHGSAWTAETHSLRMNVEERNFINNESSCYVFISSQKKRNLDINYKFILSGLQFEASQCRKTGSMNLLGSTQ